LSALVKAIRNWQREEIVLLPPLHESAIAARLEALKRPYSRDVVALYAATGGMDDGHSDAHLLSLWSLDRVVKETTSYNRPYILFADFLIDSHFYCFKYRDEDMSAVAVDYLNGEEPELVAASVEEFFETLNTDPGKLMVLDEH
jgi:hypothetical protein